MKRRTVQLLLLAFLTCSAAEAIGQVSTSPTTTTTSTTQQINCSSGTASTKLVCEFPFASGALTNNTALGGTSGAAQGAQSAEAVATTINAGIAAQISQLPLASASAGKVVIYKAGVPQTLDDLGPIMTDRAQTLGKHKLFLGFNASQYVFTDIDGTSLSSLNLGYSKTAYNAGGNVQSVTYSSETTNLNFRIDQLLWAATFGLSNHIDASVIVPWERISIAANTAYGYSYVLDANNDFVFQYVPTPGTTYTPGLAHGIGDIVFNLKGKLWEHETSAVAVAVNVRTPTGDDMNLLGSGAWGVNPYLMYSRLGKISPHFKVGYQWNTQSELNNPTNTAGSNQSLPGGMQYDAGADVVLHRGLNLVGDFMGSQFSNVPVLKNVASTVKTSDATPYYFTLPSSEVGTSTYWANNISGGLKWNPVGGFVISGNVMYQVNNSGLRARPVPSLGISYKF